MKKVLIGMLILCILGSTCYASGYSELPRPDINSFSDDFNSYGDVSAAGYSSQINSNWAKESEKTQEPSSGSAAAGTDGKCLFLSTNTSSAAIKYTTSNYKYFSAVRLVKTPDVLCNQVITVDASKTHNSDMYGIRFMLYDGDNGTENYYTLLIGGLYTYAVERDYLTYGLYKNVNGNVTALKEKIRKNNNADDIDGYIGTGVSKITVSYLDGKISWSISYENGGTKYVYNDTYTDSMPFETDKKPSVGFCVAGSDDPNRRVSFDNLNIKSNIPYITSEEPDNVLYKNLLDDGVVSNDKIDFGKPEKIRKIIYNGTKTEGEILVSDNQVDWYKLADLSEFSNGLFLNNKSDAGFRYVKAPGIIDDIAVLSEIDKIEVIYTDNEFQLYPRVGGKDFFDKTDGVIKSADDSIAYVNGNLLAPCGIGETVITVTDSENSFEVPFKSENGIYSYNDGFDGFGTYLFTGSNKQFNTAWRSKNSEEGKMGYNNDVQFGFKNDKIFVQARGACDGDSYSRYPRWADTVPSVVFNAEHSGLTENQIIKTDISKVSGTETAGVRFKVHDGGNSYYALLFPGMYGLAGLTDKNTWANSSWELIKCDGGQYTMLDYKERTEGADSENGFLSFGEGKLVIEYIDGKINWKMDVYSGNTYLYSWGSTVTDEKCFETGSGNSTVWLMSGLYSGDDTGRGCYFDNISIASYVPFITANEPEFIIYRNVLEDVVSEGTVYKINGRTVRRIAASDVAEPTSVYVSKDNKIWYKMHTFTVNGDWLNNLYADKFNFIKVIGGGKIELLCEIEDAGIELILGETAKIYPYKNGSAAEFVMNEKANCVSVSKNSIKGTSAVRNDIIEVVCGENKEDVKVTVKLINPDIKISKSGDDYCLAVTSDQLKETESCVILVYFNPDHSVDRIYSYPSNFSDGTEKITLPQRVSTNGYMKVLVWNNADEAVAYTNEKTIYAYEGGFENE